MKLTRFYMRDEIRVGAVTHSGIVDLTEKGYGGDILSIDLDAAAKEVELHTALYTSMHTNTPYTLSHSGFHDAKTIKYAKITNPKKIICAGLNYRDHAEETGGTPPKDPIIFTKFADTLSACGDEITLPPHLRAYDYEAELVVVIGKDAFNVPEDEIDEYIFGYTCGNDLSARDAQFLSAQWEAGKNLPGFAPAGPYIVTKDEFNPENKAIKCRLNGVTVQNGSSANMIFSARYYAAAASRYFKLSAGDLIFTGTPAGVILGKPKGSRVWLKPGDTVEVEIEGIGTLVNALV